MLSKQYDSALGGFSRAPKFPRTSVFDLMFHVASKPGPNANTARDMAVFTLKQVIHIYFYIAERDLNFLSQMANGGIYDHLAGGFHRYSVTADWHVPHFEKML